MPVQVSDIRAAAKISVRVRSVRAKTGVDYLFCGTIVEASELFDVKNGNMPK